MWVQPRWYLYTEMIKFKWWRTGEVIEMFLSASDSLLGSYLKADVSPQKGTEPNRIHLYSPATESNKQTLRWLDLDFSVVGITNDTYESSRKILSICKKSLIGETIKVSNIKSRQSIKRFIILGDNIEQQKKGTSPSAILNLVY